MDNIPVKDSYYVKPTGERTAYVWYGWSAALKQSGKKLWIQTLQDTLGSGGEYWIAPEYMSKEIIWESDRNWSAGFFSNTQFLENCVIMDCSIPARLQGASVDLDIEALTEIEIAAWDSREKMQVVRIYKPEA